MKMKRHMKQNDDEGVQDEETYEVTNVDEGVQDEETYEVTNVDEGV